LDSSAHLHEKIWLASKSPRRAEILQAVGWPFEIMLAGIDEARRPSEAADNYVKRLAREKAMAIMDRIDAGLVLGADTVVVVDGEILGQPKNEEDARRMLKLLSGKWHEVLTGVALIRAGEGFDSAVEYQRTRVKFAEISDEEINSYLATGEPMDKAGAYAIQGRAALFIEAIDGDYFNIVGLPIRLIYEMREKIARRRSLD